MFIIVVVNFLTIIIYIWLSASHPHVKGPRGLRQETLRIDVRCTADKLSPLVNKLPHVVRPLTSEVHLLSRPWMHEAKGLGVQGLPRTHLEAVLYKGLIGAAALSA